MRVELRVLGALLVTAACCTAAAGSAAAATATGTVGGGWGSIEQVPGIDSLSSYGAQAVAVSCASPGNCAVGGGYDTSASSSAGQAYVVNEVNGVWGSAQEVPGSAALNNGGYAMLNLLSCPSPGYCTGSGFDHWMNGDVNYNAIFVVDEKAGIWGLAQGVPNMPALNAGRIAYGSSLTCPSAGNCVLDGTYLDVAGGQQAFVVNEVNGTWQDAQEVPGTAALNTGAAALAGSVACSSAGNCLMGGSYLTSGGHQGAFAAQESGGAWGSAQPVPSVAGATQGGPATARVLSCGSPGNCVIGGSYAGGPADSPAYVADEVKGTLGAAQLIPGLATLDTGSGAPGIDALSCESAGNCDAVGYYFSSSDDGLFTIEESAGAWGTPQVLPGSSVTATTGPPIAGGPDAVGALSCPAPGACSVGGDITPAGFLERAFVADESGATWGTATEWGGALDNGSQVVDLQCVAPGNCVAVGRYRVGSSLSVPFIAERTWTQPTSAALSLSASTVPYGGEEAEVVTATVTAGVGAPSGTVRVASAGATVCVITLTAGRGTCKVPAAAFGVGPVSLTGSYAGNPAFGASTSPPAGFTVVRAATTTSLTLSPAQVPYGHEQSERASVSVRAAGGGVPAGTVAVKYGSAVICTATLTAGKGSCLVPATRFPVGTVSLVASYGGSSGYSPSASAAQRFAIVKAASKTALTLSATKVTYGHETAETLSVSVLPQYAGTPPGTVQVTSGSLTLCTITLKSGKGSCALAATKLAVGTHSLIARYWGSGDFLPSASVAKALTVTK